MHVGIVNVFLIPNIDQIVGNNSDEDMGIINVICVPATSSTVSHPLRSPLPQIHISK